MSTINATTRQRHSQKKTCRDLSRQCTADTARIHQQPRPHPFWYTCRSSETSPDGPKTVVVDGRRQSKHYTINIPTRTNRNLAVAFLLMVTAMGDKKWRETATATDASNSTMRSFGFCILCNSHYWYNAIHVKTDLWTPPIRQRNPLVITFYVILINDIILFM